MARQNTTRVKYDAFCCQGRSRGWVGGVAWLCAERGASWAWPPHVFSLEAFQVWTTSNPWDLRSREISRRGAGAPNSRAVSWSVLQRKRYFMSKMQKAGGSTETWWTFSVRRDSRGVPNCPNTKTYETPNLEKHRQRSCPVVFKSFRFFCWWKREIKEESRASANTCCFQVWMSCNLHKVFLVGSKIISADRHRLAVAMAICINSNAGRHGDQKNTNHAGTNFADVWAEGIMNLFTSAPHDWLVIKILYEFKKIKESKKEIVNWNLKLWAWSDFINLSCS